MNTEFKSPVKDIETKEGYFYLNRSGAEIGPLIWNNSPSNYLHTYFIPGHGEFLNGPLTSRYFRHIEPPKPDLDLIKPTVEARVILTYSEVKNLISELWDAINDENSSFYESDFLEKLKWQKAEVIG